MTELKTLKDMKWKCPNCEYEPGFGTIHDLAIKWVKTHDNIEGDLNPARDMFMDFHNITEEDLK